MRPGDFQIGVLDFFAILMPGGLATWLITRYVSLEELFRQLSFGATSGLPDRSVLWGAFLLSSYVLGHFVFMLGARLDTSYDRWRERTKPKASDQTFQAANELRKRLTTSLASSKFTTLKWAKAYIQLNAPAARAEIDRLEADSKFFRSLVVVMVAIALHALFVEGMPVLGAACLGLATLAYRRYFDQRWKLTELCFGTAVVLEATRPSGAAPGGAAPED